MILVFIFSPRGNFGYAVARAIGAQAIIQHVLLKGLGRVKDLGNFLGMRNGLGTIATNGI